MFERVIDDVMTTLLFLGLIAGRRQNIENLQIEIGQDDDPVGLDVYWCLRPTRDKIAGERSLMPTDLPINAGINPVHFGSVLTRWLAEHDQRREARGRFFSGFTLQNAYEIDRLISAANLFDLMPSSASPAEVDLTPEFIAARDEAKAMFKALPETAQRNSVLAALGRSAAPALRDKIAHRARQVIAQCGPEFSSLPGVIAMAVDCRNHYVHGSAPKADYTRHFFETVPFLTDTLEFVFGAADLLDAGWDLPAFREQGSTLSHPFGAYLVSYDDSLRVLNTVLPEGRKIS